MTSTSILALSATLLASSLSGTPAEAGYPLADSTWVEPSLLSGSSSLSADFDRSANLTLAEDGSAGGYDGCNWFSGSWEQHGDEIVFPGHWTATERACGPHDPWVLQADSAEVAGDVLLLFDAAGNQLGLLVRQ